MFEPIKKLKDIELKIVHHVHVLVDVLEELRLL